MSTTQPVDRDRIQFDDNRLLPALFDHHDEHLVQIERLLDVRLRYRGNRLEILGPRASREIADRAISALYQRVSAGQELGHGEVAAAVRFAASDTGDSMAELTIRTPRRQVAPRSPGQGAYIKALGEKELVFGLGPAGTGKTYLAVAQAVSMLLEGRIDRIVLSRPAVEAGEHLGFLPGDLQEKIDPYLRPLYDALYDMLPPEQVSGRVSSGEIEIAPLAFMRGRTLANAFVILDEAQNTSPTQIKMFLTRMGEGSRMAITGDTSQVDLPSGMKSGLVDALDVLDGVEGVAKIRFTAADVVRHPLVTRIVRAYNRRDDNQAATADG